MQFGVVACLFTSYNLQKQFSATLWFNFGTALIPADYKLVGLLLLTRPISIQIYILKLIPNILSTLFQKLESVIPISPTTWQRFWDTCADYLMQASNNHNAIIFRDLVALWLSLEKGSAVILFRQKKRRHGETFPSLTIVWITLCWLATNKNHLF